MMLMLIFRELIDSSVFFSQSIVLELYNLFIATHSINFMTAIVATSCAIFYMNLQCEDAMKYAKF